VNAAIEIRKTPDGKIQARRFDGKPLTPEDREEARRMALTEELPLRAWVVQEIRNGNSLQAVKICSAVLEDHVWLILDRRFEPKDNLAIYYPEELSELRGKTRSSYRRYTTSSWPFLGVG
jgi:hypothetical protein